MLGSFIGTYRAQSTYHLISKDKKVRTPKNNHLSFYYLDINDLNPKTPKSRTPGLEEYSLYYTGLPKEQKPVIRGYWHKNPYINYQLLESGLQIDGVDFETTVGSFTLATSFEGLSPTGVDFETSVGSFSLFLTTSESLIPTGVDFETVVGTPSIGRGLIADGVDLQTEVGTVFVSTIVESKCRIGHELTPFFLNKQQSTNPSSIVRQFSFQNSNLSEMVTKFPTVSRNYKDVVGKPFSITLENASKTMNVLIQDRTKFRQLGEVSYGYQFNPSHIDLACMGKGFLINANYSNGKTTMQFRNQLDILSQTFVSIDTTSRNGALFTNTPYNPADITFDILTANSYGAGLSSIESVTNPDIDFESFTAWKSSLGSDAIVGHAFFPYGTNYVQALQSAQEMTDSAIYIEANNKIYFRRNVIGTNSFSAVVSGTDIVTISARGDAYDMCNQYVVPTSFSVQSNQLSQNPHASIVINNTGSQNSYGVIQKSPTTKLFWHINSAAAINLGQRITFRRREPEVEITLKTPMKFMQQQLGDLMFVNIDELDIQGDPYTIIGTKVDMENQTQEFDLSVGHGISVANLTVFELDDAELGTLNNTVAVLG